MWAKRNGFTIVELLIVIVVIAILATITVVAFNGIQDRAENTSTMAAVKAYYQTLLIYAIDNKSYPDPTNQWCLGEGYVCGDIGTISTIANTALRPYFNGIAKLPTPSTKPVQYYSDTQRTGAAYGYLVNATLDGVPYPWGISYVLRGKVNCGLDNIAGVPSGQSWPSFTRTPNASGATETSPTGNVYCRMILPDPATM